MAVEMELSKNERVVVVKYKGQMTAGEFAEVAKFLNSALERASRPIHNITDLSEVTAYPPNLLTVIRGGQKALRHPMLGKSFIVTTSTFTATLVSAIGRVFPFISIQVVKSLREAWSEIDRALAAEAQD